MLLLDQDATGNSVKLFAKHFIAIVSRVVELFYKIEVVSSVLRCVIMYNEGLQCIAKDPCPM